jgi:transposase
MLPDQDLEATDMKRKHMNHIQDIIQRLQQGESERRITQDLQIARGTVHKYSKIAKEKGYLGKTGAQPSDGELREALGPGVQAPKQASTVEPYREKIQEWVKAGVEMTAIWLRLQENYGYKGEYSCVRRFVLRLEPVEPEAFIRVHRDPGEGMQVDFGSVGQLYDPVTKRMRTAYVFVATLGYSRHQYAELVFDQKVATWIALHPFLLCKSLTEYSEAFPQFQRGRT